MKRIESRDNPLVKRLRKLALGHAARDENLALLEGDHLVRAWLEAGHTCEHVLVSDAGVHRPDVVQCMDAARARHINVIAVPDPVMRHLSSLDSAPPIIATVIPPSKSVSDLQGQDCVVLDGVQDPGNVGAILRTAAAAGVTGVLAGRGCASLWSPKVLRAGMGAHAVLALVEVNDLVADIQRLRVPLIGTTIDAASSLYRVDLKPPCAWIFGHEGHGISDEIKQILQQRVRIPHETRIESINVAAAVAVCLFEMRRQRGLIN
ncbi:MAG TPA: RNA methyltransferase [Burkholderiaceae bacterium]|nr:RNA methyltransferase [Burkholderiaceae bacterium]